MRELEIREPIEDRRTIYAIAAICTLPALVIIFQPMLVGGMVTGLELSESDSGFVLSADMAGYTFGTVASFFGISRYNWRSATFCSLVFMAACNFISAFFTDFSGLLLSRFFSGLAGGVITAITFAALARARDPDAAYGVWLVFQSIVGIVGMYLFPSLNAMWGVGGAFFILGVLLLLSCTLVRFIPVGGVEPHVDESHDGINMLKLCLPALLAIFITYSGLMMVWPFVERIGDAAGVSGGEIGLSLSVSAFAGLVGGLAAAYFGARYGRFLPITLSILGLCSSIMLLNSNTISYFTYMLAVSLFFGLWGFLLPYLLGVVAARDNSGRMLTLANGGIGAGLGLGPLAGALLLGKGDYSTLLIAGMALIVIAYLLILGNIRRQSESIPADVSA